jgi:hypothetical protein
VKLKIQKGVKTRNKKLKTFVIKTYLQNDTISPLKGLYSTRQKGARIHYKPTNSNEG